jgi:hypothetical protein
MQASLTDTAPGFQASLCVRGVNAGDQKRTLHFGENERKQGNRSHASSEVSLQPYVEHEIQVRAQAADVQVMREAQWTLAL